MTKDWGAYYENVKHRPVSALLVRALEYVAKKEAALDMGAGTLRDSVYLIQAGFKTVTAIDQSPHINTFAADIHNHALLIQNSAFEDFDFQKNHYDLISAMFSLPFMKKEDFGTVFNRMKNALASGGIFCGQLFGVQDEWKENKNMSFHTKDEVLALLDGFKILSLEEIEKDGTQADGKQKHWHIFNIIAQKI